MQHFTPPFISHVNFRFPLTLFFNNRAFIAQFDRNHGGLVLSRESLMSIYNIKQSAKDLIDNACKESLLNIYEFALLGSSLLRNGYSLETYKYRDITDCFVLWLELFNWKITGNELVITLPTKAQLIDKCSFKDALTSQVFCPFREFIDTIFNSNTSTGQIKLIDQAYPQQTTKRPYTRKNQSPEFVLKPVKLPFNL